MEQGAFVRGRSITENIAMALEAMRNLNRRISGGNIILKLDLEKAYDRLDWNFLKQVLLRFGFSNRWVALMELACWGNSWFSVLVNGEVAGFFKSSRGLHPISPGFFILAANAFSKSFNPESLNVVKEFLRSFQEAFGYRINNTKSCFICSKTLSAARIKSTERILGFSKARMGALYLGVPLY
ncbi:uncharacterized protein LOC131231763 [Magnolia sinica]|uniref:uncharacterized protein LOC131231763 n=1 Tax=Magnolia sinica TaxID=86752 RepID=UPI00265B4081|nr:uncharacterized protein LOC131231763 [Magnolia sinica]